MNSEGIIDDHAQYRRNDRDTSENSQELSRKTQELNHKIIELEVMGNKVDMMTARVKSKDLRINHLSEQLAEEKIRYERRKAELQKTNKDVKDENQRLQLDIKDKDRQLKEAQDSNKRNDKSDEIKSANAKLTEARARVEDLERENKRLKEQREKERKTMQDKLVQAQSALQILENDKKIYKAKVSHLKDHSDSLQNQIEVFKKEEKNVEQMNKLQEIVDSLVDEGREDYLKKGLQFQEEVSRQLEVLKNRETAREDQLTAEVQEARKKILRLEQNASHWEERAKEEEKKRREIEKQLSKVRKSKNQIDFTEQHGRMFSEIQKELGKILDQLNSGNIDKSSAEARRLLQALQNEIPKNLQRVEDELKNLPKTIAENIDELFAERTPVAVGGGVHGQRAGEAGRFFLSPDRASHSSSFEMDDKLQRFSEKIEAQSETVKLISQDIKKVPNMDDLKTLLSSKGRASVKDLVNTQLGKMIIVGFGVLFFTWITLWWTKPIGRSRMLS